MNLHGDLTYQSDETYTQEAFNSFIQDFGIEIDEDSVTVPLVYDKKMTIRQYNEDREKIRQELNETLKWLK